MLGFLGDDGETSRTKVQNVVAGSRAETIRAAVRHSRRAATPLDNTDFVARWRGKMVEKYTEAALREVAGLETDRLAPKHEA